MTTAARSALAALAGMLMASALAVGIAPSASAAPECSPVGSNVTYCETNGSTQLITKPPPWNWGGWQGIGFGPLIGGYGVGIE
ncbi:MAG: hypothetical protein SW019_18000 [Actinomycetota bacterium]|nr:hypothetical protein [Actinomycetota bacterium]